MDTEYAFYHSPQPQDTTTVPILSTVPSLAKPKHSLPQINTYTPAPLTLATKIIKTPRLSRPAVKSKSKPKGQSLDELLKETLGLPILFVAGTTSHSIDIDDIDDTDSESDSEEPTSERSSTDHENSAHVTTTSRSNSVYSALASVESMLKWSIDYLFFEDIETDSPMSATPNARSPSKSHRRTASLLNNADSTAVFDEEGVVTGWLD